MIAAWSWVLSAIGVTGLFIAARWPKVGWWFNIAAQAVWVVYDVDTRQWGFLLAGAFYTAGYVQLLRRAYQPTEGSQR